MDVWQNAAANAKPDCPRCHGTGSYMYDHNHGTVCNLCCQHNMGWWQLSEAHGATRAGKWCCTAGCGYVVDTPPSEQPGTQPEAGQ